MQLLQGWLGRVEKALPRKHLLSMVGGEAMASLILSPLLWQMPVTKRPRKSSSDLDQGSPSVTEEENSETSSESEKNSDQVRGFGDAVARVAGRTSLWEWGRGWREPDWLYTVMTPFHISSYLCFPPGFHSREEASGPGPKEDAGSREEEEGEGLLI